MRDFLNLVPIGMSVHVPVVIAAFSVYIAKKSCERWVFFFFFSLCVANTRLVPFKQSFVALNYLPRYDCGRVRV